MVQINGTFKGGVATQTSVAIPDKPLHALAVITVTGVHSSDAELWNGARLTYWSMGDLLGGAGTISGYFHNHHTNGDTTFGTFEAEVTVNSSLHAITKGKWQLMSGTGGFQGISGGGQFESHAETPPISVDMTWSGDYTMRD